MNTDIISVRPKHSLEVVMRYLRAQRELPKNTDQIFVVSRENKYLGSLPISSILDLGRNDTGKVSKINTVKVTESFKIERYSHVMHIVSNVEGVTNVDSVGLVTARSGIEIGARPGVAASISVDGNMIVSGISTFGGDVQVPEIGRAHV